MQQCAITNVITNHSRHNTLHAGRGNKVSVSAHSLPPNLLTFTRGPACLWDKHTGGKNYLQCQKQLVATIQMPHTPQYSSQMADVKAHQHRWIKKNTINAYKRHWGWIFSACKHNKSVWDGWELLMPAPWLHLYTIIHFNLPSKQHYFCLQLHLCPRDN